MGLQFSRRQNEEYLSIDQYLEHKSSRKNTDIYSEELICDYFEYKEDCNDKIMSKMINNKTKNDNNHNSKIFVNNNENYEKNKMNNNEYQLFNKFATI